VIGKYTWSLLEKSSLYYDAEAMAGIVCARARLLSPRRFEGGKEVFVRLNEIVGGGEEEGFQARILQQDECAQ